MCDETAPVVWRRNISPSLQSKRVRIPPSVSFNRNQTFLWELILAAHWYPFSLKLCSSFWESGGAVGEGPCYRAHPEWKIFVSAPGRVIQGWLYSGKVFPISSGTWRSLPQMLRVVVQIGIKSELWQASKCNGGDVILCKNMCGFEKWSLLPWWRPKSFALNAFVYIFDNTSTFTQTEWTESSLVAEKKEHGRLTHLKEQ